METSCPPSASPSTPATVSPHATSTPTSIEATAASSASPAPSSAAPFPSSSSSVVAQSAAVDCPLVTLKLYLQHTTRRFPIAWNSSFAHLQSEIMELARLQPNDSFRIALKVSGPFDTLDARNLYCNMQSNASCADRVLVSSCHSCFSLFYLNVVFLCADW
jgi:hypothetical protein